jgi:hypothetical protein
MGLFSRYSPKIRWKRPFIPRPARTSQLTEFPDDDVRAAFSCTTVAKAPNEISSKIYFAYRSPGDMQGSGFVESTGHVEKWAKSLAHPSSVMGTSSVVKTQYS